VESVPSLITLNQKVYLNDLKWPHVSDCNLLQVTSLTFTFYCNYTPWHQVI